MTVSTADRQKWARQVAALKAAQTDEGPSPDAMAAIIAAANLERSRRGLAPLGDRFANPPEAGFYERAERLGLRLSRR